jgi:hypothetical protein
MILKFPYNVGNYSDKLRVYYLVTHNHNPWNQLLLLCTYFVGNRISYYWEINSGISDTVFRELSPLCEKTS